MSGTITTINTPLVGTTGGNGQTAGASGQDGGPASESAAPFSNENFTTLPGLTSLDPEVTGGAGGAGEQGSVGANAVPTITYDSNFDETVTYGPGGSGGAAGSGGGGGSGMLQMSDDTLSTAASAFSGSFSLDAFAAGGSGGIGAYGGSGGNAGYNDVGPGAPNPNNGDPTITTITGAQGGGGGSGGSGGDGGTGTSTVAAMTSYVADGTALTIVARGGAGGTGYGGYPGSIGGETSAGGTGGNGGAGGQANATLSGSTLADDFDVTVDVNAIGGAGAAAGAGGAGGVAETFSPDSEPSSTYQTANGADGGAGGAGGAAEAAMTGNTITAPQVMIELYADEGVGGAGGAGGSGGDGVSTPTTTYENGLTGAAGAAGATGAGLIDFSGNVITVGTYIPSATNHSDNNDLVVNLIVGSGGTYAALNGAAGGNLAFSGNQFLGTGTSQLELQLYGGAANGGAIVNTAAGTLSIDGSAANAMTGFDNFILDNGDTFIAGTGTYVVQFQPDPDTLVYGPTSGQVTLEGVTGSNLLLDFSGFGASLTEAAVLADTSISGGNTFIAIPGTGGIELFGYTGGIPPADISFATPCFLAGTRIATARGAVAVEDLRVGDDACLASGGSRPVRWIGTRRIDPARHPKPKDILPVRVSRDAFGPGLPERDLHLSPDHAVYVEQVLIPVRYLVNGTTIRQLPASGRIVYFHVELDRHDILLAEGLPVESYLETGCRAAFQNGGAPMRLHPDFASREWEAHGYAPLVVTGPELLQAQRTLARNAVAAEFSVPARPVPRSARQAR